MSKRVDASEHHKQAGADLVTLFEGHWAIRRDILDLDSEWLGRLEGQAVFAPQGNGLMLYREEGRLKFGGLEDVQATRDYRWQVHAGGRVEVFFADGSAFHDFAFSYGRAEASHYCDPDTYEVTYDFTRWPEWRAEWRVEGPRKDYRMVTVYSRGA